MVKSTVTIGNLSVEPGKKQSGFWFVSSNIGGQPIPIPMTVINGREPGPTVWIQAGLHGDEYHSVAAALEIATALQPESICGQIALVTILNPPALENRTRQSGVDGVNLNTAFPGSMYGTTSHIMAAEILEEVKRVADFAVDLHGGGIEIALPPYTLYYEDGSGQGLSMAKAFGAAILVKTDSSDRWADGMFYTQASKHGVPSILAEAGYGARVTPEDVDIHLKGVKGVLAHLGVLKGVEPSSSPTFITTVIGEDSRTKTLQGGFVRIAIEPGAMVKRGQRIGTTYNYLGEKVDELVASTDGIVVDLLACPVAGPGQLVAFIGKPI